MRNRKLPALLLAGVLAAALALPAAAEEYAGSESWKVRFTGTEMVSNFETGKMDEAIYAMQPGDTANFTLALTNDSTYLTDWYMTNKVLKSLEDSQTVANGGAYTYELTYTDTNGAVRVLYSSDSVGGEKSTAAGEGLHEATDSLKNYFFLDELAVGDTGRINLTVALEGETQGNAYQDTLAELQMNFAVEPVTVTTIEKTPAPGKPTPTPGIATPAPADTPAPTAPGTGGGGKPTPRVRVVYVSRIPQTNDPAQLALIAGIAGASGLALLVLAVMRLRKNRKH